MSRTDRQPIGLAGAVAAARLPRRATCSADAALRAAGAAATLPDAVGRAAAAIPRPPRAPPRCSTWPPTTSPRSTTSKRCSPVPHLLRPRRHPQPRRGPAAAQADLPARRIRCWSTTSCPTISRSCWSSPRRASRPRPMRLLLRAPRRASNCCGWRCASRASPWVDVLESVSATLPAAARRRGDARSPASPPQGRPRSRSAWPRSRRRSTCREPAGGRAMNVVPASSPCPTSPSRSSSSATTGATATTSSAGPPARPSSTSAGCCASAARCSTSASCSCSSATSAA